MQKDRLEREQKQNLSKYLLTKKQIKSLQNKKRFKKKKNCKNAYTKLNSKK